ncbi:hypothetical protein BV898_18371 [Hypsibius exemplaris]|uniref:G-protein coupled receptors family 1 profile domain-containing protein n=1 Tax=Hypsibius exemplaris TaxID=2072580 RepID=A0A9X6RNF1_HYPEX|nr:hypothetical protein BV898_18371 [Hypsibius exemplaris]
MNKNSSNLSGVAATPLQLLSPAKQRELSAWIATTLIISFFGVLNNILTLRVIWSVKLRKPGVSLLIFHFVAVNLLMCLVTLPTAILVVMGKRDGWFMIAGNSCSYFAVLYTINVSVVNWSDAGLAANRLVALYLPHRYRAWTRPAVSLAIILCCWLICVVIALPFTLSAGGQGTVRSGLGMCNITPRGRFGDFLLSTHTYVPYAISGIGSLLILWKFFSVSRLRNGDVAPYRTGHVVARHRMRTQRRLNMAKIVLLNFLWSVVCAFPGYVINSAFAFLYYKDPVGVLWVRTSAACQYVFTPCIFLLSNPEYQRRLRGLVNRR